MPFTLGGLVETDCDHGDIGQSRDFPDPGNQRLLGWKHGQGTV